MKSLSETLQFISTLDGWLSSHEGFFLYNAAKYAKGDIVEIGSWMGKSTICLAAGSKAGNKNRVIAIDPHKGEFSKGDGIGKKAPTFKKFQANIQAAGVSDIVKPILATSEEAAKKWKKPISLLFIDGLHDYQHTMQDFSFWSPLLAKRGVVAFHDAFCGHTGPERVILEHILSDSEWSDIGVVGSIVYAKRAKVVTLSQKVNKFRHRILIPLALKLNKSMLPKTITFFLIHRLLKLLLLNKYTWALQVKK